MNEKGKYGFVVKKSANKVEIKKEIEKMYGVKVENINTMVYQGKRKTRYTKSRVLEGRTDAFKKSHCDGSRGRSNRFLRRNIKEL